MHDAFFTQRLRYAETAAEDARIDDAVMTGLSSWWSSMPRPACLSVRGTAGKKKTRAHGIGQGPVMERS